MSSKSFVFCVETLICYITFIYGIIGETIFKDNYSILDNSPWVPYFCDTLSYNCYDYCFFIKGSGWLKRTIDVSNYINIRMEYKISNFYEHPLEAIDFLYIEYALNNSETTWYQIARMTDNDLYQARQIVTSIWNFDKSVDYNTGLIIRFRNAGQTLDNNFDGVKIQEIALYGDESSNDGYETLWGPHDYDEINSNNNWVTSQIDQYLGALAIYGGGYIEQTSNSTGYKNLRLRFALRNSDNYPLETSSGDKCRFYYKFNNGTKIYMNEWNYEDIQAIEDIQQTINLPSILDDSFPIYIGFDAIGSGGSNDRVYVVRISMQGIPITTPPTMLPSNTPTTTPTATTQDPSSTPTNQPTPLIIITDSPTISPTNIPTDIPTETPTKAPTKSPTHPLSNAPTTTPTLTPSTTPTTSPTNIPSNLPSITPSNVPSTTPTIPPTLYPSKYPSNFPSLTPTLPTESTLFPSHNPSVSPTQDDTYKFTITLNKKNLMIILFGTIFCCIFLLCCMLASIIKRRMALKSALKKDKSSLAAEDNLHTIHAQTQSMISLSKPETSTPGDIKDGPQPQVYQEQMMQRVSYFIDKTNSLRTDATGDNNGNNGEIIPNNPTTPKNKPMIAVPDVSPPLSGHYNHRTNGNDNNDGDGFNLTTAGNDELFD